MRVAFAIQHFPPYRGGAEQQARLLARRVAAAVERCDVITSRHDSRLPRTSWEGPARVIRLPTAGPPRLRRALNGLAAFAYFALHGARYDVVHAHCLSPFALGAIVGARLRGARTVLKVCTVGACGDLAKVRGARLGTLLMRGFKSADRWIATSTAGHAEALAELSAAERVELIPNAVEIDRAVPNRDPGSIATARKRLGLADEATCLFVGRLVAGKGLDAIVEAWPAIQSATGAALVIVGDGPLAAELRDWTSSPIARGSVRLVGWQADPASYYAASDVLLFPSAAEAFGNVLAEGMAHGLAVVTTRVGLAERWARHRDNAWLVDAGNDDHALAEAIQHAAIGILADAELRRRLGDRARATVLSRFADEMVTRAYLDLYARLVPSRSPADRAPPVPQPTASRENDHA